MRKLDVVVALVFCEGRLFLQRRDAHAKVMPGLWELPGGKVDPGEDPFAALYRELEEEVRWTPEESIPLDPFPFAYPDRSVLLHPFRCSGPGWLHSPLAWGWFRLAETQKLAVPDATRALLDTLVS